MTNLADGVALEMFPIRSRVKALKAVMDEERELFPLFLQAVDNRDTRQMADLLERRRKLYCRWRAIAKEIRELQIRK